MIYESTYYNQNYLSHFGILGMHWGIRRYQNKDGSLTSAGKKRYSVKDIENDFNQKIEANADVYKRINQANEDIPEESNKLMKDYEKAFANAKPDANSKTRVMQKLRDAFSDGCDDREFFEEILNEYADEELMAKVNTAVKNKRAAFNSKIDAYWHDVNSLVSEISEKYSNAIVKDGGLKSNGELAVNSLIDKKLDTSLNSYITRHFDDYWVYDTDAHYKAQKRFSKELGITMKDFNKKM